MENKNIYEDGKIVRNKEAQLKLKERIKARREKERVPSAMRMRIRFLLETDPRVKSFAWFANEVLGISPNSLSRKLTGKDRHFNDVEIEICKEYFGEDAMNIDKYEIVDGQLVNRDEE